MECLNVGRIHPPRPAWGSRNRVALRAEEELLVPEECPGTQINVELRRLFNVENSKDGVDFLGNGAIVQDSHSHRLCARFVVSVLVLVTARRRLG